MSLHVLRFSAACLLAPHIRKLQQLHKTIHCRWAGMAAAPLTTVAGNRKSPTRQYFWKGKI